MSSAHHQLLVFSFLGSFDKTTHLRHFFSRKKNITEYCLIKWNLGTLARCEIVVKFLHAPARGILMTHDLI